MLRNIAKNKMRAVFEMTRWKKMQWSLGVSTDTYIEQIHWISTLLNFHRALLNFHIVANLGNKKFTLFAFGFHTVLNPEVLLGFELLQCFSLINYEWRRRVPFVVIKNGEPMWMIRRTNLSLKVLNNYVDWEISFFR